MTTPPKKLKIGPPVIIDGAPVWDLEDLLRASWRQAADTGKCVSMAELSEALTAKYHAKWAKRSSS